MTQSSSMALGNKRREQTKTVTWTEHRIGSQAGRAASALLTFIV